MRVLILMWLGSALLAQDASLVVGPVVRPVLGGLRITGLPDPTQARVLLINAAGEGCNETVELPGAAEVTIGAHVNEKCWRNDPLTGLGTFDPLAGLMVMAPDRATAYISGKSLVARRLAFPVEMRPRREVVIDVWPASPEFALAARDDLANFDWILEKHLTGVALKPRFHPPHSRISQGDPARKIGPINCANAESQELYTPGVINLYYGAGEGNQSCGGNSVVLIHNIPVLGDAAHELGHKLGLNQSDSEAMYNTGHTTGKPRFTDLNAMWEASEILKHELSAGQAAWMGLSCSSFIAFQGACLPCEPNNSGAAGVRSRCPRFALGQAEMAESVPVACTVEQAKRLLEKQPGRLVANPENKIRFCTQSELRLRLIERYRQLQRHVQGRPDLPLSTKSETAFVNWWMIRISTIVLIESIWAARQDGLEFDTLQKLFESGPLKGHTYLNWSRQKISEALHSDGKSVYQPRCETGASAPETSPPVAAK